MRLGVTVANGGKVASAGGLDFVFAGTDGVTKLNHEIEAYDGVTGTLTAWGAGAVLESIGGYALAPVLR